MYHYFGIVSFFLMLTACGSRSALDSGGEGGNCDINNSSADGGGGAACNGLYVVGNKLNQRMRIALIREGTLVVPEYSTPDGQFVGPDPVCIPASILADSAHLGIYLQCGHELCSVSTVARGISFYPEKRFYIPEYGLNGPTQDDFAWLGVQGLDFVISLEKERFDISLSTVTGEVVVWLDVLKK